MLWTRRDWLYLLALTLLAAALRFYKLGEAPPGFQFDEAFNAIDAEQVWYGNRPLFLPANGGREALYTYVQAALGALFGFNVYTLRLASALAGILTIPAAYWLLRTLLQRRSRLVALFTSLALAVSFWHLHFSHYGIRVILMPLLLSGLFGSYWLALHGARKRTRWIALLCAGLLTGLAPWTHPAGRFVPFVLIGYTGWLLWRNPRPTSPAPRGHPRGGATNPLSEVGEGRGGVTNSLPEVGEGRDGVHPLRTLILTGVIAFLVFLPLGLEFYHHPDFFLGHASEVSIFAERVSGESHPWRLLGQNLLLVLGMFNFHGDVEWAHNIPGRPVFEWPLGLAFLLGVVFWAGRLLRPRQNDPRHDDPDVDALALLAGWVAVMLLPSILSEAAPNYSRTLPALPAAFVPVGLGLAWIAEWPLRWRSRQTPNKIPRWSGYAVALFLVAVSGSWATYDYFVRYPQMPESYYTYDADKLDALTTLEELAAAGNTVYLAPLWSEHATFAYLRDSSIIKALDSSETIVLPPPGEGAVYAFPAEKLERAQGLTELWPDRAAETVNDRYGKPLLALLQIPADQLTTWPERYQPEAQPATELPAYFDDAPTLLGLQQRNDHSELRLFWRAEAPTLRSLTTFLHFIDRDGRRVAQIDKLPGDGSYLTPTWSPGERVIERYDPEIEDSCVGGDELTLLVGWYELAADGARRPRIDANGAPLDTDMANAGTVTFPMIAYPPADITLPPATNLTIDDDLTLYGYAINTDVVQPGAAFTLDLYWIMSNALNSEPVTLQLRLGDRAVPLWQEVVAPAVPWHEGEILCRRVHATLPADLQPGNFGLELTTTAHETAVPFYTLVVANE